MFEIALMCFDVSMCLVCTVHLLVSLRLVFQRQWPPHYKILPVKKAPFYPEHTYLSAFTTHSGTNTFLKSASEASTRVLLFIQQGPEKGRTENASEASTSRYLQTYTNCFGHIVVFYLSLIHI